MAGWLGQLIQLLPHPFQFRRLKDGRDRRRQGVGNDPLAFQRITGLTHRAQGALATVQCAVVLEQSLGEFLKM